MDGARAKRLAVLGLDGMSRQLLLYGVERGYMPALKRLLSRGMVLRDMDCIPPLTLPSWTSIMTGVNPGKHGIFDFFKYRVVSENKWVAELVTVHELEHPRIHEMVGLLGGRTRMFLLNIVPPYPLIPVRNADILQIEFFTPKPASSPPRLLERYKGYVEEIERIGLHKSAGCDAVERGRRLLEVYHAIIEDVLSRDYDFYWFLTPIPDQILHKCYRAVREPSMLARVYEEVDRIIDRIVSNVGNIMIVSDHGFKYYTKRMYLNKILYREGFIAKPSSAGESGMLERARGGERIKVFRVGGLLYRAASSKPLRPLSLAVLKVVRLVLSKLGYELSLRYETGIDFIRSKAFVPSGETTMPVCFYIIVNDPDPATISRLKRSLEKYDIRVAEPREVFNGPYLDRAPGLVIVPEPDDDRVFIPGTIYTPIVSAKGMASHSRYGIFAAHLETDRFNLDVLPNPIPNTLPASLALLFYGYPVSSETDHIDLLEKVVGKVKKANIIGKWRIYKRIHLRKTVHLTKFPH